MSSRKSRARTNRTQKIVAIIVLISMLLGGATFFAAVSTSTPSPQPTPTQGP
jgi:small neutral amino acid transporter SnatA (MarC family)